MREAGCGEAWATGREARQAEARGAGESAAPPSSMQTMQIRLSASFASIWGNRSKGEQARPLSAADQQRQVQPRSTRCSGALG